MLMNTATQNQAELEKILAGTDDIQLSPPILALGQSLFAQLQENWQRAAEIASEGMAQSPNYLALRSQAAFSWLSAGDPKTAQQILQDYQLKPVEGSPNWWLKALIDLKNNDLEAAATSLENYLGRSIQVETELKETFLLSLWNTPGNLEGKVDLAFYFPTLPPSITGFDIPITRVSLNTSEFIDNLIAKKHKDETKDCDNGLEQTSSSVGLRYILHLSDLHITKPDQAKLWSNQLAEDLRRELEIPHLDALILSGDIANHSTPEEYQAAEQFLHHLRQDFPLEPEQIIIVPGNHDLNWQQAKDAYKLVDLEYYEGEPEEGHYIKVDDTVIRVRDEDKYKQRFVNFSNFYEAIANQPYPQDYNQQGILYHLPEQNLLFLGLNSAWQLDHHYKSRASINMNALSKAITEIRRNRDYDNCLKIAVWHHPVVSANEDRITDTAFLDQLAVAGFRFFLHGHIHKAETSNYRYDRSQNGRKLDQICAGTFGAPTQELVTGTPWQYNLLQFEADKLTVRTRRRSKENGAWEADSIWRQGKGNSSVDYYTIDL
ncbi:MAG: metallophosphoesterase [Symploca sp. SIO2E6]|nr:metallophosphoesterase [Symploca sp. SIO2E6]